MNVMINNGMRIIVFEDKKLCNNLGIAANDLEFIDITNNLPEFPEKLYDIMALDNMNLALLDALYYENKVAKIKDIRLKAPLCLEKYLWFYAENNRQKGAYLQAMRGITGHKTALCAPFANGLNFIPHVVFTTNSVMHKIHPREAIGHVAGFTLLNLGLVAPVPEQKSLLRGLATQFEGFSAAGPWLLLCDCQSFLKGKALQVVRNGQHLAEIKLGRIVHKAAEVMSTLSETLTLTPGDMVALPLHSAFEVVAGDSLSLYLDGFGTLNNVVAVS